MRKNTPNQADGPTHLRGFTLIELLVVIAVIGMLAGLVLTIMPAVGAKKARSVATAEMFQTIAAIEAYKADHGFYPPDNPTNVYFNPLYFELVGTVFVNHGNVGGYQTIDGSYWVATNSLKSVVGVTGINNSATDAKGDDDRPAPKNYLSELKYTQLATNNGVRILVCSLGWDGQPNAVNDFCSWRYNSSHPTNNPGSYDLWVDVFMRDKTNRISNWSKAPQIVP